MAKKREDWKFRLKIFFWYLSTEPIRQIVKLFKDIGKWIKTQNKTLTWAYVATILFTISLFINDKFLAAICFIFILIVIILFEYDRGYFMHRYRQQYKKRIKKKIKLEGFDMNSPNLKKK